MAEYGTDDEECGTADYGTDDEECGTADYGTDDEECGAAAYSTDYQVCGATDKPGFAASRNPVYYIWLAAILRFSRLKALLRGGGRRFIQQAEDQNSDAGKQEARDDFI